MPEGVVLPHVQDPRDADFTSRRGLRGLIAKHPAEFIRRYVRAFFPAGRPAQPFFAAVAGYKGSFYITCTERIYSKKTVILAFSAAFKLQIYLKVFQIFKLCNSGTYIMEGSFRFARFWSR